jgi:voltage-gated potassium channel
MFGAGPVRWEMGRAQLRAILRPESPAPSARLWRGLHHAMTAVGIGVVLAATVAEWREQYATAIDGGFYLVSAFFIAEYVARLIAAAGDPSAAQRSARQSAWAYVGSLGGGFDLLGVLPGVFYAVLGTPDALLLGVVWIFKLVRYTPGLAGLQRVVSRARQSLFSVLLGFVVVLLASASLEYLIERRADPDKFASIPAALWWAIETVTTTGYGDNVPGTPPGRILAGAVMVCGILVLALSAGILATGFAEEMRRYAFLRTWSIVAKVPFFREVGASIIAEVAWLLRPLNFPAGAVVVRRGERGDCMYFIATGAVEIRLPAAPLRLGEGDFFGEIALLTGSPRNATVIAVEPATLLRLDIVEFRELMGRRPDLARVILEAAGRRLESLAPQPVPGPEPA